MRFKTGERAVPILLMVVWWLNIFLGVFKASAMNSAGGSRLHRHHSRGLVQQENTDMPSANYENNDRNVSSGRFTPAPAVYEPSSSLPVYDTSKLPQSSQGPLDPSILSSASPYTGQQCKTLLEVLQSLPDAFSNWTQLLSDVGFQAVILTDPSVQTTLLVPINSAFNAGIDAMPLRSETTLSDLIGDAPDVKPPLAGYSVIKGLWPSTALQTPGTTLPTEDTIDKVNPLNITVTSSTKLQGIGNTATILQADIAACGPSIIHVVDQILLPFRFDQGPTDAITGTQVAQTSESSYDTSSASPAAPGRR